MRTRRSHSFNVAICPDVEAAAIGDWVCIAIVADDHDGDMSHGFFVPLRVCVDQKLAAISNFG